MRGSNLISITETIPSLQPPRPLSSPLHVFLRCTGEGNHSPLRAVVLRNHSVSNIS